MSKIIIKCVKEKNKLRIKFHSYFDSEGKEYHNVYNNNYNCRFPKSIRFENRYYEISENDLNTVITSGKPYYCVTTKNIKILKNYGEETEKIDIDKIKIFSVDECVVCLNDSPNIIFLPCGHQCTCQICYNLISQASADCPLCKKSINNTYLTEQEV